MPCFLLEIFCSFGLVGLPLEIELWDMIPPTLVVTSRPTQASYASVTAGAVHSTAYPISEPAQRYQWWSELLGLNLASNKQEQSLNSSRKVNRLPLSSQHLPGLIEAEPLSFSILTASEATKVENAETGTKVLHPLEILGWWTAGPGP